MEGKVAIRTLPLLTTNSMFTFGIITVSVTKLVDNSTERFFSDTQGNFVLFRAALSFKCRTHSLFYETRSGVVSLYFIYL